MRVIQERIFYSFLRFKEYTAIEYGNRAISYGELDRYSNRTANFLLKTSGKGAFIGCLIDDRLDFIVTMVGILKAGCVFVPLEPNYPIMRLQTIIKSTDLSLIICDDEIIKRHKDNENAQKFISVNEISNYISDEKPKVQYSEDDKIYVYNTSGTTGVPKAVVGKNISLLHFIAWEVKTFSIDSSFRCSQFTNVSFDVFLRDSLVPLCSGACVCIPMSGEVILDGNKLIQWIDENRINLIHCVPSVFYLLNTDALNGSIFNDLKYILLAGEKVRPEILGNWFNIFNNRIQLVNLYGPTETTLAKVYYLITEEDRHKKNIPIGKPIDGSQVMILTKDMQLCDELETGEIYINTPYMSFGYYKNKEQTDAVFVKNPYSECPSDMIYKTGDIGRLLSDGNIELLGRTDRQIKIRGIRIELEEIESVIEKNQTIKEAVVVYKELSEITQILNAYVVFKDISKKYDESVARELMKDISLELPQYMVPANIIILNEIPRKINGKIDYSALKDPSEVPLNCIAPRDLLEHQLLEIWKAILGIENLSIDDGFFERGGNSLSLMHLILRINEEYNVEISIEQIVLENTIERQAVFIKNFVKDSIIKMPLVEKKICYSTSSAQGRLYFLQQIDKTSTIHNLSIVAEIKGAIDKQHLENVLNLLLKRHDSLRTSFNIEGDTLVQVINEDIKIEIVDFVIDSDTKGIKESVQRLIKCFDLSKAPLLRVFLSNNYLESQIIVIDIHHIIFDGFSQRILINDLVALYNNIELPELIIQYKEYAEYQNSKVMNEIRKKQESYWLKQFGGMSPVLKLPLDHEENSQQNNDADVLQIIIDEQRANKLKKVSQNNDTTLFTVLLASCYILLSKYVGKEDIIIGIPVNGRKYSGLDNVIGMFVNTIALRSFPCHFKKFTTYLGEVKSKLIGALENQDYPFDELVNKLKLNRVDHVNPLFEVMFQMQKATKKCYSLSKIEIIELDIYLNTDFKLTFNITEYDEKLSVEVIYMKDLIERETVKQLISQYEDIISTLCENTNICIGEFGTDAEDRQDDNNYLNIAFNLE